MLARTDKLRGINDVRLKLQVSGMAIEVIVCGSAPFLLLANLTSTILIPQPGTPRLPTCESVSQLFCCLFALKCPLRGLLRRQKLSLNVNIMQN